jgi:hypothetical protein
LMTAPRAHSDWPMMRFLPFTGLQPPVAVDFLNSLAT